MKRTLLAALLALVAACASSDLRPLLEASVADAPWLPQPQWCTHLHPSPATDHFVRNVAETFPLMRIQAPAGQEARTIELIRAAPSTSRFIVLLYEGSALATVSELAHDPRVVAWELENEPDNCKRGFLCWTPEQYAAWVPRVLPEVQLRRGPHQEILPAASMSILNGDSLDWLEACLGLGCYDGFDRMAAHVYDWDVNKLARARRLLDLAQARTRLGGLLVTEAGDHADPGGATYHHDMPAILAAGGIPVRTWCVYAANDTGLGFALYPPDPGGGRTDGALVQKLKWLWQLRDPRGMP